ncbi:YbaK/EbsC family protein [Vibrio sp. ZSDZ34]|uniref:YbaK/EbsC family protein n=1 Tax=Vibrio gelatinilyticus TaxID=2893468 RepID=A0A9X2AWL2_9VIBR|nr:YbaK/EbsC family protein [Vibrio gelatinilyticus]MCJ2377485.1 YbaK/EbsC family protein [Vibrio gelatinilyticus]
MTIATRLDRYLHSHDIQFQTVQHNHSHSSMHSGVTAGVPLVSLAKGVVLEDHEGRHVMAVLPANNKISLSRVNDELNASFHLVKEQQVYQMFGDCDHGAVPPIGSAYHMSTVCDEMLTHLDYVYIEAGDHETLLKLDRNAFKELMGESKCFRFSSQIFH